MNIDNLCMSCMTELFGEKQCPKCGYYVNSPQVSPYLPLKTPIGEKYIVGKVLSSNSEGATYMAYDVERRTPVVIREFLPEKMVERTMQSPAVTVKAEWSSVYFVYLRKFLDLWRRLACVRGLSALTPVIDILEANNTAYAVTEYIESITLREFLLRSQTGYLNWEKAKVLFMPVLSTLSALHNSGIIHNGINPDNMLIGRDGKLRLSGFSISEARVEGSELNPELFDGYTPIEQYGYNYQIGRWSDVYAFCAVIYRALVGSVPQDAVSRASNDKLIIPARYAEIIPVYVINALMNGLQVDPYERTKDIEILRDELSATPSNVVSSFSGVNVPPVQERAPAPPPPPPASPANEQESSTGKIVLITFLIILILGLLGFGGYMVYDKFANPEETKPPQQQEEDSFEVENFAGQPYEYIVQVQQKRFKITTVWEYSNTVEKGKIISQSIQPGTTVKRGTELTLVISNGIEYITIPQDLVGKTVEDAEQKLLDAGFVVSIRYETNDGTQIPDTVIGVNPQSGTSHPRNGKIELTVWGELPEPESSTNWLENFF